MIAETQHETLQGTRDTRHHLKRCDGVPNRIVLLYVLGPHFLFVSFFNLPLLTVIQIRGHMAGRLSSPLPIAVRGLTDIFIARRLRPFSAPVNLRRMALYIDIPAQPTLLYIQVVRFQYILFTTSSIHFQERESSLDGVQSALLGSIRIHT